MEAAPLSVGRWPLAVVSDLHATEPCTRYLVPDTWDPTPGKMEVPS